MNRYQLTNKVEKKFKPVIQKFLNRMENLSIYQIEQMDNKEFSIDLSDTELRPYTLLELLKEFGYENEEFNYNGWQLDFWIDISKESCYPSTCENLCIHGCGITFELILSVREFM